MNKIFYNSFLTTLLLITLFGAVRFAHSDKIRYVANPLRDKDVVVSKKMLSWSEAKSKCEESKLILLTIDSEDNNNFLNFAPFLKSKPFSETTSFWSSARFTSPEYTELFWETTDGKIPFLKFRANNANGITKWWAGGEPYDDSGVGNDLCVDINFPGASSPPIWAASDCDHLKHFICIRPSKLRDKDETPVKFVDESENETDSSEKPVPGIFYPDEKTAKPIGGKLNSTTFVFTPTKEIGPMRQDIIGTFKPSIELNEQSDFLTKHGQLLKPNVEGDIEFISDKSVMGEFTLDSGSVVISGNLTQDAKQLFIPSEKFPFKKVISGTWKPSVGILLNYPCKTIRGTMRPPPTKSNNNVQFTPDLVVNGIFIPDGNNAKPISGSLTQANPPEFTSHSRGGKIKKATNGTWKPRPFTNKESISHGTMKPSGEFTIFVPDDEMVEDTSSKTISPVSSATTINYYGNKAVVGLFISDSIPKKLVKGTLTPGELLVFSPEDLDAAIGSPTAGTFKPESNQTSTSSYPFSTFHGVMTPYPEVKGSSSFAVEASVSGEFRADKGSVIFAGTMVQENSTFTPEFPPLITNPTPGWWRSIPGALPVYPCKVIHGTMSPDLGQGSKFTPDPRIQGSFIPDTLQKAIGGSLTQENPPQFFPASSVDLFEKPQSGTWKPNRLNLHTSTAHGVMKLTVDDAKKIIFMPDDEIPGKFIIESDPDNPVEGLMTTGVEQQIFTPNEEIDLSKVIIGTWNPTSPPNPSGILGVLKPNVNLPENSAFFRPKGLAEEGRNEKSEFSFGKFYLDDISKRAIIAKLSTDNNKIFVVNGTDDLFKKLVFGTWVPEKAANPNDPFASLHGVVEDEVFIADTILDGTFTPDFSQVPIPGSLYMEKRPKLFMPKLLDEQILIAVAGRWRPTKGSSNYLAVHGVMRPSVTSVGSSNFIPDLTIEGEFTIHGKEFPVAGTMNQGIPTIFSPYESVDAASDLYGSWRPLVGVTVNHPFTGVLGVLKQVPGSTPLSQFYTFATVERTKGLFTPDDSNRRAVKGTAIFTNPITFMATNPADLYKMPTSGTWKPLEPYVPANDPVYYSHCLIKPPRNRKEAAIIVADNSISGSFLPDGANVTGTIYGTLTRGNRPVFKADIGDDPVPTTVTGLWTPHSSGNSRAIPTPVHGSLKPSQAKTLPYLYAFFVADLTSSPHQ